MKIAVVGKGGAGKTTIAGTLARMLAEAGEKVLAIDGDPNPNLALALGIARDAAANIKGIPASIMVAKEEPNGSRTLHMTVPHDELVANFGVGAANNIDLIVIGRPPDGSAGSG